MHRVNALLEANDLNCVICQVLPAKKERESIFVNKKISICKPIRDV